MDILFLGGFYSESIELKYNLDCNGNLQAAANRVQEELIKGFVSFENVNLNVISAPFVGGFPNASSILKFPKEKEVIHGVDIKYIPFINIWGIKNVFRKRNLQKEIREFIALKSESKFIFIYSVHTPLLQAAIYAKQQDPSIKICMYIPDLPQYMNLSGDISLLYKVAKKYDIKVFESLVKHVDGFLFITKHIRNMVPLTNQMWMVIEGIAPSAVDKVLVTDNLSKFNLNKRTKKIVYTGTLNYKFGIKNLIDSFELVKEDNVELIICGSGEAEEYILNRQKIDPRIKYLGKVSGSESLILQQQATILVNPRENDDEYTKYSFPSKTMEYLASGNPVICYKLEGIPEEYDAYLNYVDVKGLAAKLEDVLAISAVERERKGNISRQFVMEQKNNVVVVKSILDFLQQI